MRFCLSSSLMSHTARARSLRGKEDRGPEERKQTAAKEAARFVLNDGNSPRSKHQETMRVRCLQRSSSFDIQVLPHSDSTNGSFVRVELRLSRQSRICAYTLDIKYYRY